jgi:hypothetical protein
MPAEIAATSDAGNGWVISIPDTSPAKNGRDTGSIGRIEIVMAMVCSVHQL